MSGQAEAINTAVVAGRRAYEAAYLTDVCTILRRDIERETDGSRETQYKPLPVQVRCKVLTDSKGSEVEQGDQLVAVASFEVRFPVGTDIRETDKLTVNGQTFAVTGLDSGRSNALYMGVICVRAS